MNLEMRRELDRLKAASKDGLLHCDAVIEAASKESSPLHSWFTWDREAGFMENLRYEARKLMAEYEVVYTHNEHPITTRYLVSLSPDRTAGGGYRTIDDVMTDADLRDVLFRDALAELDRIKRKYAALRALQPVFDAIEKVRHLAMRKPRKRRSAEHGAPPPAG